MELAGISKTNKPQHRFTYNGKEKQSEFGLNWLSYGQREYDAAIGRFNRVDRFADSLYAVSPYHYGKNDPIKFVDVNGDSVAVFRLGDGKFIGFRDDGKKTWSGAIMTTNQSDDEVTVSTFNFNDPKVDIQAIKNGVIKKIRVIDDKEVDQIMKKSGVYENRGARRGIFYAKREGQNGGKMDYAAQGQITGRFLKNTFYIRRTNKQDGVAYNVADFGNYLIGRAFSILKVPLGVGLMGAHWNNYRSYRKGHGDFTAFFDFGPGTYGAPGVFDSAGDQRAIRRGYYSHSSTTKYWKEDLIISP